MRANALILLEVRGFEKVLSCHGIFPMQKVSVLYEN